MAKNDIPVGSLKPNSMRYKEEEAKKEPKVAPIVQATKRKKSVGEKFAEAFIVEDSKSVLNDVIHDNLIPEAKNTFVNAVFDYLSGVLGTNVRRPSSSGGGKFNYAQVSSNYQYNSNNNRRTESNRYNSRDSYQDALFKTKDDALKVLRSLESYAEEYNGQASVSLFFDYCGMSPRSFTDNDYGWTSEMLAKAYPKRIREGWILDLPSPIPLD